MCWLAHITEQLIFKKHAAKLDLRWLLVGGTVPDIFGLLKVAIYAGLIDYQQHRGGQLGTFHTPFFGLLMASLIYLFYFRNSHWKPTVRAKLAAISLLVGQWSHIVSDSFDSKGCMLLYPFSKVRYPIGFWEYRADRGLVNDFIYFHWGQPYAPLIEYSFAAWAAWILYRGGKLQWGDRVIPVPTLYPKLLAVGYGLFIWAPFVVLRLIGYDFG